MPLRRWRPRAVAPPERISRAAGPLLIIRVIEGLAAWVFFNEYFSIEPVRWLVQGAFVAYLLLNLLVVLRYRVGHVSTLWLGIDIAANVLTLGLPIAASGGHLSPLMVLLPLKAIPYGLVFGPQAGVAFMAAAAAMLGGMEWADREVVISVVPLSDLAAGTFDHAVAFALLAAFVGGPLATLWLRWALTPDAAALRGTPERADRDVTPAAVANALLMVSEAVSRATRLDEILEKVVEIAPRAIEMDYCGVALWAEESGQYVRAVASGTGMGDGVASGLQLSPEQVPDFEWVRRLGHCVVVPVAESLQVAPTDVPAVLIAPLSSGPRFFGVMEFARRSARGAFTQRDMTIADGIARQTAVAIERTRLVEESRRLIRAVESTEEAVLITDPKRRVIYANPAFLRTLALRREQVIGHDAFEFAGDLGEPLESFVETLQRRSWRGETTVRRSDGTPIPVMLNASLIRDADGRVQGAVAIVEDISEEKRFQSQMQRADRLAAVGEMAAGIAHEINNALAAIFGQTDPNEPRTPDELRAALGRVDAQARRIADIVQGVLGFARPRPPRPEPVDLAALAAKTLELVRHDLGRQAVRLETDFAPDLPPALADVQQLQQVLLNLFGNAIQAMAGRADAWLRVEVRADGDRLVLRVSDAGPGIPPEILARIFDPFFSTKSEGSGLGLSVSYAIARAHGGDLRAESPPGQGAVFTLVLPSGAPAADTVLQRALLIDDDDAVAESLTAMLAREGLQVTRAATGAEGWQLLSDDGWDAVFLDVRLPDLSGPEIYRRLADARPHLAQRVVFVTGGVWRSESRLRQELPPQPILAKPCTQDALRDVLRALRAQRRHAA
ncbi:MAG: ATP-binding protein [Deltaproteobacteria bacterium]|nr:ATP-binding protein [Deltaproteobacteria bacterium]